MSRYATVNPSTGELLEEYEPVSDSGLERLLSRSGDAYREWAQSSLQARIEKVRKVAALHLERRQELARIIGLEIGKPIRQALGEVGLSARIYEYFCDNAPDFLEDEPIELPSGDGRAFIRREPIGPLIGIMPWNFPCYQVARFAGANLVLGNTILHKPAPQCPRTAEALQRIFDDAGLPDGAFQTILASDEQVAGAIADPRVRGVSLTGSERAGAAVAEIAGRNLKKVVLELGGSDPFILLGTDDIEAAVKAAAFSRLGNSGQACNAAKRFIVIDDLYDRFLEGFTARMGAAAYGDPAEESTRYGPLSSQPASERLRSQVDRAVAQGATVVAGGGNDGNYWESTILADVGPENDAYREELFGPVAIVHRVASEQEAIDLANDTSFGLGSYVFTDDPEQADRVAGRLEAGMVFVNGVGLESPELPFGGVKRSGFGRELGPHGMNEFANEKLIRVVE